MTGKSLKLAMEEESIERGCPIVLPTGGLPLRVTVSERPSRPQKSEEQKPVFSLDDAKTLKRKRGFSHDDMEEVRLYIKDSRYITRLDTRLPQTRASGQEQ